MKINAIDGNSTLRLAEAQRLIQDQRSLSRKIESDDRLVRAGEPEVSPEADRAEATPSESIADHEKVRGVIRLLEAGHFKGVADVRLRINSFDQLSERAAASTQPVLDERSAEVVEAVNVRVDELADTLAVDDETRRSIGELVEAFDAQVREAVDAAAGTGDVNTLTDPIQSAFDLLVQQMTELLSGSATTTEGVTQTGEGALTPQVDPEPLLTTLRSVVSVADSETRVSSDRALTSLNEVDVAVTEVSDAPLLGPVDETGGEATADPAATLEEALSSLKAVFQEALSTLIASIETATQLPDPSAPTGSGVAYDKFLAIYNELRGLGPSVDQQA